MRHLRSSILLAGALTAIALPSTGRAQTAIQIATLEWPPYVGASLPGDGVTAAVLQAAFRSSGYAPTISYMPWKRAVEETAQANSAVVAFFPGYHCKQRDGFIASNPMGNGPLGFAERTDAPLGWSTLDDLKGKTIGVVQGYANTTEFDARAADGRLKTDPSNNDSSNIKKLAMGRIDAAVVDRYVLEYALKTDPQLKPHADKVRFNAKPLEDKMLYLCVRDDEPGRKIVEAFNAGLAKLELDAFAASYFQQNF